MSITIVVKNRGNSVPMGWNRAVQRECETRYLLTYKFHALIKYSLKNPRKVFNRIAFLSFVNVYKSIVIL